MDDHGASAEAIGAHLRSLARALDATQTGAAASLQDGAVSAEDRAFWASCAPDVIQDVGVFVATLEGSAADTVARIKALVQSGDRGLLRVAVASFYGLKVAKRWDVLQLASVNLLDVVYETIQPRLEDDDGEVLLLLVGLYASILVGYQHSGELFCRARQQIEALTPMIAAVDHETLSHCYVTAIAALIHFHRAYEQESAVIRQSLESAFGGELANRSIADSEIALRNAAWVLPPAELNRYFSSIEGKWVLDDFSTEQHASATAAPQNAGSITLRNDSNALAFEYRATIEGVRGNPDLQLDGSLFQLLSGESQKVDGWKLDGHWSQVLGDAEGVAMPVNVRPEPWTCGACTLSNEGTATKCATCSADAPRNHSLQTTQSGAKVTNPAPFKAEFDADHTFMRVRWSRGEQSGVWMAKKETITPEFDLRRSVQEATAVAMVDSNILPAFAFSPQGKPSRVLVLEKSYPLSTYGELAVELWAQCDLTAKHVAKQTLLSAGEFELYWQQPSGELVWAVGSGQHTVSVPSALADGHFHHVALVFGRQVMQILVDGVVVGQVDQGTGDGSIVTRRSAWWSLGGSISDDGQLMDACFHGVLLDLRVWSNLTSRSQYQPASALSGMEPGLIGYFPLVGESHRILVDASKHDNHATVFGATASADQSTSFLASSPVEGIPVKGGFASGIGAFEISGFATVDDAASLRVEHPCAIWHKDTSPINLGFESTVAVDLDHSHTSRVVFALTEASYWDVTPLINEVRSLGSSPVADDRDSSLESALFISLEKAETGSAVIGVHVWKERRARQLCRIRDVPLRNGEATGFSIIYHQATSVLTIQVLGSGLTVDVAMDLKTALDLRSGRVRTGVILTSIQEPQAAAPPAISVLNNWTFASRSEAEADDATSSDLHFIYPQLKRPGAPADAINGSDAQATATGVTIACTRSTSDGSAIEQPTYGCQTCGVVHGAGICRVCAAVCHEGHELVFMGAMITACACSMRAVGHCKCATPFAAPAPAMTPKVAHWYCNRCTVVNTVGQSTCSVCSNTAPDNNALGLAGIDKPPAAESSSRALVPVQPVNTTPLTAAVVPTVPAQWSCPACTYLNAATAAKCTICDTANPSPPPASSDKPAAKDGLMTLYYAAENQKNGPTPDPPLATLVPSGPWACEACTMENDAASTSCFMCQTAKPTPPAATPVQSTPEVYRDSPTPVESVPMEVDSSPSQAASPTLLDSNIVRLREAQLQRALQELERADARVTLANASNTSWDTTIGALKCSVGSQPQIAVRVRGEYVEKDGYVEGLARQVGPDGRWKLDGRFKKLTQSQENAVTLTWDHDGSKFTGKWFRGDGSGEWKCLASPLVNEFRGLAPVDAAKPQLGLQPYYSGLINMKQNLTNVCYQNSYLQSLFLTQAFRHLILSSKCENYVHLPDESGGGSRGDVLKAVQDLFARLVSSQRPELDSHSLQRCLPSTFQAGRQQDPSDFAHFLIDALSQQFSQHEATAHGIDSVFGGTQATVLACKTCGKKSINREYFWEMLLNMIDLRYTPITSICAVTGTSSEISTPSGYERINSDVNKDRNNAPYVYLCVKRKPENATSELPITDLVVKVVGFADVKPVLDGYERVELDLNFGGTTAVIGGKKQVYLFFRRELNGSPITDLQVIYGSEAVPDGFKQIRVDLNQGDGAKVFLCYRCDMPVTDIKIVNTGIPGYKMVDHILNRSNEDAAKQYLAFKVGGNEPCITDLQLVPLDEATALSEQGWEVIGSPSSGVASEGGQLPDVLVIRRGHGNPIFAIDVFRAPREVPRYNDYEVIDLYGRANETAAVDSGDLALSLKGDWLAGEAVDRTRKAVRIHSVSDPIAEALVIKGSFDDKGEVTAVATAATSSWSTVGQASSNRVLRVSGYWKSAKVKQPQLLDLELRRGGSDDSEAMYTLTGTIGDGRGRAVAVTGVQTSRSVRIKWPISQILVLRGDERVPEGVEVVRETCSGKTGNVLAQTQSPHTLYLAVKREEAPSEGFVSDVCVIYGEIDAIPENYTCVSATPAGHPANLNDGTAGVPIFVCYRRVQAETEKRLFDLALMWTSGAQADATVPAGFTKIQHTPLGMEANLNQGTNGVGIHLCFAKCDPGDVVKPVDDAINGAYELTAQPAAVVGGTAGTSVLPLISKFIRLSVAEKTEAAYTLEGKFGTVFHGYLPGMLRGTLYTSRQRNKRVVTGVWMSDQQNASSMIDFVPPSYPFEWTLNEAGTEVDGWWSGVEELPPVASVTVVTPSASSSSSSSSGSSSASSGATALNSWKLAKDAYVRVAFKKDYGTEWRNGQLVSSERVWRHDVESMLARFVASRTLGGDNLITCTQCERKTESRTNTVVVSPPAHLIITVKRMFYDWVQQKTRKCLHDVTFPSLLTLPSMDSEDEAAIYTDEDTAEMRRRHRQRQYGLYGVLVHSGLTANSGHYFSFCRESDDRTKQLHLPDSPLAPWIKFNDSRVERSSWAEINDAVSSSVSDTVYLLLYKRLSYVVAEEEKEAAPEDTAVENMAMETDQSSEDDEAMLLAKAMALSMSAASQLKKAVVEEEMKGDEASDAAEPVDEQPTLSLDRRVINEVEAANLQFLMDTMRSSTSAVHVHDLHEFLSLRFGLLQVSDPSS